MFSSRQQTDPIRASHSWWWPRHTKGIFARASRLLASAAGSRHLQGIISSNVTRQPDSFITSYLPFWSAICLEVHRPINPFQANSQFGTDQEFWPTNPSMVESDMSNEHEKASFCRTVAASAPRSGDWLLALPLLRVRNDVVCTAVDSLWPCPCGAAQVDAYGVQGSNPEAKITRHHGLAVSQSLAVLSVQLLNWPPQANVRKMQICPTPTSSSLQL